MTLYLAKKGIALFWGDTSCFESYLVFVEPIFDYSWYVAFAVSLHSLSVFISLIPLYFLHLFTFSKKKKKKERNLMSLFENIPENLLVRTNFIGIAYQQANV